MTRMAYED